MKRIAIVALVLTGLAAVAWTQFRVQDLRAEVDSLEGQMQQSLDARLARFEDLDARLARFEELVFAQGTDPGLEASLGRLDILTQNLDVRVQLLQSATRNRAPTSQVQPLEMEWGTEIRRLGDLVNSRTSNLPALEDRVEGLERRTEAQARLGLVDRTSDRLARLTRRMDRLELRLGNLRVSCNHVMMPVPPDCRVTY